MRNSSIERTTHSRSTAEMGWDKEDEDEKQETLSERNPSTVTVEDTITTEPTTVSVSDSDEEATITGEQDDIAGDADWDSDPHDEFYSSDDGISDPERMGEVRKAPGKAEWKETEKQIEVFLSRWARRSLNNVPAKERDRLFIKHARRAGMSATAMANTNILKTGKTDPGAIVYRIQKLKENKKDVEPRTAQTAWRRYQTRQRIENNDLTPKAAESKRLQDAMQNGSTVEAIVESKIVTIGINNRRAIQKRWDTFRRRDVAVPVFKTDRVKKQGKRKTQFKKEGGKNTGKAKKVNEKREEEKVDEEQEPTMEEEQGSNVAEEQGPTVEEEQGPAVEEGAEVVGGATDEGGEEAAGEDDWFWKMWDRVTVL